MSLEFEVSQLDPGVYQYLVVWDKGSKNIPFIKH
jgi:hypothetical protein